MIEHPHYCGPAMPVSRMKVETAALRAGTCSPRRRSGHMRDGPVRRYGRAKLRGGSGP
jgi:hypothetical protein